jgi:hypothetical protein
MKHDFKIKNYARYTDDFIVISENIHYLKNLIKPIQEFLMDVLQLNLHPKKIEIRKYTNGIDFLGYIILPRHRLVRKRTKKRILRKFRKKVLLYKSGAISEKTLEQSLQSYLGILSHADAYEFSQFLKNQRIFL